MTTTLATLIVGDNPIDPWFLVDTAGNIVKLTGLTGGTSGQAPCNFTVIIQDASKPKDTIGIGIITIVDANLGSIKYAWNAADSIGVMAGYVSPQNFNVYVRIVDGSGNTNTYGPVVQPMSRA